MPPAVPAARCQPPDQCVREIVANRHAPHAARSFVRRAFGYRADDLLMVVDELVSNAVVHARGTSLTLALQRLPDGVLVEVADADRNPPVPRDAAELDGSGRGLAIVEALSVRWGWRPEPNGKVVFAVIKDDSTTRWLA